MKQAAAAAIGLVAFGMGAPVGALSGVAAAPLRGPTSFADIVDGLTPAVVNISTTQKSRNGAPGDDLFASKKFGGRAVSLGSGFIVDPSGVIVTNNHVVENAEEIVVTLSDRREFKARIRAVDTETDIAVLQLDAAGQKFRSVSFGDSTKSRVGDWVIAIGNPFGLGGSVTSGIISARNRNIDANSVFDDYIQTDAPINRGNSGGPLFDLTGRVIGINTAIYAPAGGSVGVGFAVPSEIAALTVDQLVKFGETRRGWLGISLDAVSPQLALQLGFDHPQGAVVTRVNANGPAAKAGVLPQDVVLDFNRRQVANPQDLTRAVTETPIGAVAPMTIIRNHKKLTLQVRVDRREKQTLAAASGAWTPTGPLPTGAVKGAGFVLQSPTPDVIRAFGLDADVEGVVVTAIDPASPAARVLQPGDVIQEIGYQKTTRPDAAIEQLDKLRNINSGPVQILIRRGDLLTYEQIRP